MSGGRLQAFLGSLEKIARSVVENIAEILLEYGELNQSERLSEVNLWLDSVNQVHNLKLKTELSVDEAHSIPEFWRDFTAEDMFVVKLFLEYLKDNQDDLQTLCQNVDEVMKRRFGESYFKLEDDVPPPLDLPDGESETSKKVELPKSKSQSIPGLPLGCVLQKAAEASRKSDLKLIPPSKKTSQPASDDKSAVKVDISKKDPVKAVESGKFTEAAPSIQSSLFRVARDEQSSRNGGDELPPLLQVVSPLKARDEAEDTRAVSVPKSVYPSKEVSVEKDEEVNDYQMAGALLAIVGGIVGLSVVAYAFSLIF